MDNNKLSEELLYKVTWEEAFDRFVASVEDYVALELPSSASSAERQLQIEMRQHLNTYKAAKLKEQKE